MSIRKNMLMAETLIDIDATGTDPWNADGYTCGCTVFIKHRTIAHINLCKFHDGFDQGVRLGYEHGLKHGKG